MAAIPIRQNDAVLWCGRLKAGSMMQIPDAPYVYLFIAKGRAELENTSSLEAGDALRLTALSEQSLRAYVRIWPLVSFPCSVRINARS